MSAGLHAQAKIAYVFDNQEGEATLRLSGLPAGASAEGIVTYPLTIARAAKLARDLTDWIARQAADVPSVPPAQRSEARP
jgi:hypothetical protein